MTVKLKGFSSLSLVAKETWPLKVPRTPVLRPTVKVVKAPGASVVLPKPDARKKRSGTVMVGPSVRLVLPMFRTVNVRVTSCCQGEGAKVHHAGIVRDVGRPGQHLDLVGGSEDGARDVDDEGVLVARRCWRWKSGR